MTEHKIMRILREVNSYSQEYVASILDINQNTYSKLESGQSKLTVDRVKKLAELYNVEPKYFLSDDLPVINYNSGSNSRAIINTQNYHDNSNTKSQKKLYEKLLKEKDEQLEILKCELKEHRKEKEQLNILIDTLLKKIKDV